MAAAQRFPRKIYGVFVVLNWLRGRAAAAAAALLLGPLRIFFVVLLTLYCTCLLYTSDAADE